MTIQFVGGLLIGMALTFLGILYSAKYLIAEEREKNNAILDLIKERDEYKKLYLKHRSRVDSD